jgi:hypothetical protein
VLPEQPEPERDQETPLLRVSFWRVAAKEVLWPTCTFVLGGDTETEIGKGGELPPTPTGFNAASSKVQFVVTGKLALTVPGVACVSLVTKLLSRVESEVQPLALVA